MLFIHSSSIKLLILSLSWEHWVSVHHRAPCKQIQALIHIWGQYSIAIPPTGRFFGSGKKPESLEGTHTDMREYIHRNATQTETWWNSGSNQGTSNNKFVCAPSMNYTLIHTNYLIHEAEGIKKCLCGNMKQRNVILSCWLLQVWRSCINFFTGCYEQVSKQSHILNLWLFMYYLFICYTNHRSQDACY